MNEREVARGIQRQKSAQDGSKLVAGVVYVPLFFVLWNLPQWTYIPPGWGYLAALFLLPMVPALVAGNYVFRRILG